MEREKFKSRLGFLLLSAGCAIGIGNVWRFPWVAGEHGGGTFVLFYLLFLAVMGIPILSMEFAIGRAARKAPVQAYQELERPGQKWHIHGYFGMFGNYVLMMFYTTVAGWMLHYFYMFMTGKLSGLDMNGIGAAFGGMLESPGIMTAWMVFVVILGFGICSFGLQNGVERISKGMMLSLLLIMVILAINSFTLDGGMEGLKFYLVPDIGRMMEVGFLNTVSAAMNQAFFTLSLGIGSMAIFGSYLDKDHALLGESVNIAVLDTFVALTAGLIIFPACFAFGVNPDAGPGLIFVTLPNVFNAMAGGRIWGTLFFLFMSFAALSTVIAVFENIMSCTMGLFNWGRKKAAVVNMVVVGIASVPCVLGFNLWAGFQPLGAGTNVLDLEDFIVSNMLLPIGSLVYLLFCVSRVGWGFEKYQSEANVGSGLKVPSWVRGYVTYVLPVLVGILIVQSIGSVLFS